MRNPNGSAPWIVAWTIAAGLTLLLFAVMSLVVLRGTTAPPAAVTPAPPVTPAVSASGVENITPEPQDSGAADGREQPDATAMAGLWLSAISAITALLGLVSSLWLGWRKERREVAQYLLESERMRLEIEKLRRDLGSDTRAET